MPSCQSDLLTRDKIAITGAGSGMGLATAKLLASRGGLISMADLNEKALHAAISSLPYCNKHLMTVLDVRDSHAVDDWIRSTVQQLGRLDGAVNMAGVITPATPIVEMTNEMWNFGFAVNAQGVFHCLRAQLRAMSVGGSIVSFI